MGCGLEEKIAVNAARARPAEVGKGEVYRKI